MHEILHAWSDGYGTAIILRMVPEERDQIGTQFAYLEVEQSEAVVDITLDASDLRTLAATVTAMADLLDAQGKGAN